jgi:hypothetical protein
MARVRCPVPWLLFRREKFRPNHPVSSSMNTTCLTEQEEELNSRLIRGWALPQASAADLTWVFLLFQSSAATCCVVLVHAREDVTTTSTPSGLFARFRCQLRIGLDRSDRNGEGRPAALPEPVVGQPNAKVCL